MEKAINPEKKIDIQKFIVFGVAILTTFISAIL